MLARLKPYYFYICLIIGLLLRIRPAITHSLWLDEAFTFSLSRLSFSDLILQTGEYWDFSHPSLYYLLVKSVSLISTNAFFLRSISLFAFLGTAYTLTLFTKSLKIKYLTPICVVLYCFHPVLVNTQYQLRMYSLIALCAILLLYCLQMMNITHKFKWAIFSALTLSIGYYFDYAMVWMGLGVVASWLFLVITKNTLVKMWSIFIFLTSLLVLPQLLIMIFHFKDAMSHQAAIANYSLSWTFYSSIYFTGMLNNNIATTLLAIVSWLLIVISFIYICFSPKKLDQRLPFFLILSLSFGLFASSLYSLIIAPIFQLRNLLSVVFFPILGIGLLISHLLQGNFKGSRILGIIMLVIITSFHFRASYLEYGLDTAIKWKSISDQINRGAIPIYIGSKKYLMTPLTSYYLPQKAEELIVLKNHDELNQINLKQQRVFIFQDYKQIGNEESLRQTPFCTKNDCQFLFP